MTTETLPIRTPALPRLRMFAAAGALALIAATLAAGPSTPLAVSDAARVKALVEETCEAFRLGDEAALERLLDARYVLVGANGAVSDKAEQLARARAMTRPGTVRTDEVTVTVHGDTAIAVGLLRLVGADGASRTLRFSETAIARDGEWRVVATQVSPLR